eukprot:CAMPEP_0117682128 /NCGR_PEP_ID=MMETSP0804-20121206/19442_1 /TAXON_ID=1074897 /ORGANISM="Tetraselmis astigmatica, Strain CCMP880" /LENGTH=565 /DNA_ID=CAMNT_0005492115 /DNA_START=210 /DNA_END=1907 /DNA_ORIENTATION=+
MLSLLLHASRRREAGLAVVLVALLLTGMAPRCKAERGAPRRALLSVVTEVRLRRYESSGNVLAATQDSDDGEAMHGHTSPAASSTKDDNDDEDNVDKEYAYGSSSGSNHPGSDGEDSLPSEKYESGAGPMLVKGYASLMQTLFFRPDSRQSPTAHRVVLEHSSYGTVNLFPCIMANGPMLVKGSAEPFEFAARPPKHMNTIVLAKLVGGTGTFCESSDWRGDLPKHMAALLPKSSVLVWENARSIGVHAKCYMCTAEGRSEELFHCDEWMTANKRTADALLMFGHGDAFCEHTSGPCEVPPWDESNPNEQMRQKHTSLYYAVTQPWVTLQTWTVHMPIAAMNLGLQSNPYGFGRIVLDSDFAKPPAQMNILLSAGCPAAPKRDVLIYASRFSSSDHKGQLAFLQNVPTEELQGFSIWFFGVDLTDEIKGQLEATAERRGIRINVLGMVSQQELWEQMCTAKGIITFPKYDMNPRVAYEAFPAGNPVYLSWESNMPEAIRSLPFVFSDRHYDVQRHQEEMIGFRFFMNFVRTADKVQLEAVRRMAMKLLEPSHVYLQLCKQMGVCR